MNTCGTCKFWGDAPDRCDPRGPKGEEFRPCKRIKMQEIDMEAESDAEWHGVISNPCSAVAVDGSGYYAAIKCRSDFGCVEWRTT